MSILVCGGAGYIGSHTVAELINLKEDIIIVDNLVNGHKDAVTGGKLYVGDILDSKFMDKVFSENNIDVVINFAAFLSVEESMKDPLKYYENNVYGTTNILKMMNKYNVKKIVFSSTAATYGIPKDPIVTEDTPTNPINPYGETKLIVERMLNWCDKAYGIKYIVLRYFNASGAHINGMLGQDNKYVTSLIPTVLQVAQGNYPYMKIYGDDYPTKDGTCIRDYIHVTDLASAHILAVKKLRNGGKSSIYNLGNGKGYTVKEIIEATRKVTGIDIKTKIFPRRDGDAPEVIASSEKIKKELGWKPKYCNIDDIIETAWNWTVNNPNGYGDAENSDT